MNDRLTSKDEWNRYWKGIELPLEVKRGINRTDDIILDTLERFAPLRGTQVLEVGGAPGQFLAYLLRHHDIQGHVLDYSDVGCEQTHANLSALGLTAFVHQADLFANTFEQRFDVVYSLGLVEHFEDFEQVVAKHVALVKPGGTLVLGCPNFRGPTAWALRRVAPKLLAQHNLSTMDSRRWARLSATLPIEQVSLEYVGGFEPRLWIPRESNSLRARTISLGARVFRRVVPERILSQANGEFTSQYLLGVFRRRQAD